MMKRDEPNSFGLENPQPADKMIGQIFDVYQITREIGRGGMGVVYLAERADKTFYQDVAIKFLKRGMDTDSILRRFRNERQILAALNHPNVARLYDGGTTENGLPYFVMEYVSGEPLYQFCDQRKLSIKERLKIFIQVCEAVHAAHQIKVIHRDLKPSNILVKENGTPKLLDFGIAKLLDPELADATLEPTATHLRMMTPEYASPEQVAGGEITPASDVYSLGVLLYELLSGHRPYRLKNRLPFEVARVVCEEYPESLGKSLESRENFAGKNEAQTLEKVLDARGSNLRQLKIELSGDLEYIVMRALQKEPSNRYLSAVEMAEDIRLQLAGGKIKKRPIVVPRKQEEAIETAKPSLAVLPLKIIGSAGFGGGQADNEYLSVGLADAIIARLSRVGRLVIRPTSSTVRFAGNNDPFAAGSELGVDFILEGNIRFVGNRIRATAQLLNVQENSTHWAEIFDEQFTDILELEDSLSEKIGQSLISKLTGEEEKQLHKRGTNSLPAYEAYLKGRFYWNLQTEEAFARAIEFFQEAVRLDPDYAQPYAAIAEYYIFIGIHCVIPFKQGSLAAKEAAEKAIALDPTLAEGYAALGFVSISFELDWKKAEELFLRAVELNPNSITAHFWYVSILTQSKRFEAANRQLDIVVKLDPNSLLAQHMRAWIEYHARDYQGSIQTHEKILAATPYYPWGLQTCSWALTRVGRFQDAVTKAKKAVELTGENPFYLTTLAAAYAESGEREKTFEILGRLDEIGRTRFVSEYMLALVYCALGDKDKAFELLEISLRELDGWMNWLGVEPQFDILRDDPRFADLLRRTGSVLAKQPDTLPTTDQTPIGSIAILPLQFIGKFVADETYLGVGLADAIITKFSHIKRITARPTSAVLRFAQTTNPLDAGRKLESDYILSGTIRRAGTRIRVSTQLIETKSEKTLWAEKFDEELIDVLQLEDKLAEKIGNLLIPQLTGDEQKELAKRGTNNPQAFDAYIRARYNLFLVTPESAKISKAYFEEAIRLDPNYALAYVGLADLIFAITTFGTMPPMQAYSTVSAMARRALEIDDSLGEAYAVLAVCSHDNYDFVTMEKLLRRSIKLNPNYPLSRMWLANLLTFYGDTDQALVEADRTIRLNPAGTFEKRQVAWIYSHNRRLDKALEIAKAALDSEPNSAQSLMFYSRILRLNNRIDESLAAAERSVKIDSQTPLIAINYAASLAAAGQNETARAVLQKFENLPADIYISPFNMAIAYISLGDVENTLRWLEYGYQTRDQRLTWIVSDPQFDSIRANPRFQKLVSDLRK